MHNEPLTTKHIAECSAISENKSKLVTTEINNQITELRQLRIRGSMAIEKAITCEKGVLLKNLKMVKSIIQSEIAKGTWAFEGRPKPQKLPDVKRKRAVAVDPDKDPLLTKKQTSILKYALLESTIRHERSEKEDATFAYTRPENH